MSGWPLIKVVSGGQTGADQAGISAAKFLNYTTGGRAPKGFMTETGPAPWLAEFGLEASPSPSLRSRTYHNVVYTSGTIIFTRDVLDYTTPAARKRHELRRKEQEATVTTPASLFQVWGLEGGTLYTAQLAVAHRRHLMINPVTQDSLHAFIYAAGIEVLNVAGTRESKAPGIYEWVYQFLVEALVPF